MTGELVVLADEDPQSAFDRLSAALQRVSQRRAGPKRRREIARLELLLVFLALERGRGREHARARLERVKSLIDVASDAELGPYWHLFNVKASLIFGDRPALEETRAFVDFIERQGLHRTALPMAAELLGLFLEHPDPQSMALLHGVIRAALSEPAEALFNRFSWAGWASLASILWRSGDGETAEYLFARVLELGDDTESRARAQLGKGILAALRRDFPAAERWFDAAIGNAQGPEFAALRELIRRNTLLMFADQGGTKRLEDYARAWLDALDAEPGEGISAETAIIVSENLSNFGYDLIALDILTRFTDYDWGPAEQSLQLTWFERLIGIFLNLADDATAVEFCTRAIALDERLARTPAGNFKLEDYERLSRIYELLVRAYGELERFDESARTRALSFLEAAKEATFSKALPMAHRGPEALALLQEEGRLLRELSVLEAESEGEYRRELGGGPGHVRLLFDAVQRDLILSPVAETEREDSLRREQRVKELKESLSALRAKTALTLLNFSSFLDVRADSLSEAVRQAQWPGRTLGLAYRLDENRREVTAYLVDSRGATRAFTTPVNPFSLYSTLEVLGQHPTRELEYISNYLTDLLLPTELMETLLRQGPNVLVLSEDTSLVGVPWETLGRDELRLGLRFAVCRTPSLLRTAKQMEARGRIDLALDSAFIVANPSGDLTGAVREGEAINRSLGRRQVRARLTTQCTGEEFMGTLHQYPLIHYAGHTNYLKADPASSFFQLSDGALSVSALAGSELHPDGFFVLSSCETGKTGRADEHRNPLGLGAILLLKGAGAVVATNWPAADEVSAEMMSRFYERLLSGGETVAEALRRVRQGLYEEGYAIEHWALYGFFGHPYFNVSLPAE